MPDASTKADRTSQDRWPVWKLAVMLYVFAATAVAINLFMVGLIFQKMGIGSLSPATALLWSIPLGVPAAWAAGRWVRHLLDEAAAGD